MPTDFLKKEFLNQIKCTVGATTFVRQSDSLMGHCIVSRELFDDNAGITTERLFLVSSITYDLAQLDEVEIEGHGRFILGMNQATDLLSFQCLLDPK